MGLMLPKPVTSSIRERGGNELFRYGSGCVNGFRENMEDAHLAYFRDNWAFFGVFDGHCNDHCSMYLEKEWKSVCDSLTMPITDERMKELSLAVDKKYLDDNPQGGSTGTFFLATRKGDKAELQVGNVGDSRVIARIGGKPVSLTEDHKPTNDEERRRIQACNGYVENARVNGSLALSRAFGDADYKRFEGGGQLNQQVIALPDVTHATVDCSPTSTDFAVLACDGVFEGNFSNEEVIEFVGKQLETVTDLAVISYRVCIEAIARGSKDNISCMVVQFKDGTAHGKTDGLKAYEFVPGPIAAPNHGGFRRAYWGMCQKGGLSPSQCLERRYDALTAEVKASAGEEAVTLEAELELFKEGPPKALAAGSPERIAWFDKIVQTFNSMGGGDSDPTATLLQLQQRGIPLAAIVDALQHGGGDDA